MLLIINSNDARTFESWGQGLCGRDQSFATVELVVPDQQNAEPHIHADTGATSVSVGFVGHDQLQKLPLRTGGWMIIRPDGYLAAAGEADDMGPAMQWLSKMTIA